MNDVAPEITPELFVASVLMLAFVATTALLALAILSRGQLA